jgi:class 3 adenylate cyclase
MRERLVLVQTNFTQVQTLADKHGWDTLHPVLEDMTGAIIDATRANGGTHRGVMQTGCFLTFTSCRDALAAIQGWQDAVRRVVARSKIPPDDLRVRVGIHHGTLHVMKFTLMGRDVEVVRHVATVGTGAEILWTHPAKEVATGERIEGDFVHREPMQLRACRERDKWIEKYADIAVFAMPLPPVSAVPAPARATKKKPSAVSS